MKPTYGAITKHSTLLEAKLALTHKRPSYRPTGAYLSPRCSTKTTNFIAIDQTANSLYSFIADQQYRATSLGREKWKTLIGSKASLQPNCNKEGFNAYTGNSQAKVRIGILGNNENDCNTCDSFIGFGTGLLGKNGPRRDRHTKAMGYILVK